MKRNEDCSNNPQNMVVFLTVEGAVRNDNFVIDLDDSYPCGTPHNASFIPLLSVYANVILNNYKENR